jgi:hypothetical protein
MSSRDMQTRALVIFGDQYGTQSVVVCPEHLQPWMKDAADENCRVSIHPADSDIECEFCRAVAPLN